MSNNLYNYSWYLGENYKDPYFAWQELFSEEECLSIIDIGLNKILPMEIGKIDEQFAETLTERRSKISYIPLKDEYDWIFQKITKAIMYNNKKWYNYDLHKIESLQFTEYDESYNGMYQRHTDTYYINRFTRKLSFSIQLSNPKDYEGGELVIHKCMTPDRLPKNQGSFIIFPSLTLQEVTPVVKGTRYCLEGCVVGPRFR